MLDTHYQHINDLVDSAQSGNEDAIIDLAAYYRPLLAQTIRKCLIRLPELATHRDDIRAEAYLALRDLVHSYDPQASYFSYYLSVWLPHNLLARCRRLLPGGDNREILFTEMHAGWEPEDLSDALGRWELKQAVQMVVALLSPPQREAIHLYFFEGLGQQEAATQLGITQSSFCKRLQRALVRVKQLLSSE